MGAMSHRIVQRETDKEEPGFESDDFSEKTPVEDFAALVAELEALGAKEDSLDSIVENSLNPMARPSAGPDSKKLLRALGRLDPTPAESTMPVEHRPERKSREPTRDYAELPPWTCFRASPDVDSNVDASQPPRPRPSTQAIEQPSISEECSIPFRAERRERAATLQARPTAHCHPAGWLPNAGFTPSFEPVRKGEPSPLKRPTAVINRGSKKCPSSEQIQGSTCLSEEASPASLASGVKTVAPGQKESLPHADPGKPGVISSGEMMVGKFHNLGAEIPTGDASVVKSARLHLDLPDMESGPVTSKLTERKRGGDSSIRVLCMGAMGLLLEATLLPSSLGDGAILPWTNLLTPGSVNFISAAFLILLVASLSVPMLVFSRACCVTAVALLLLVFGNIQLGMLIESNAFAGQPAIHALWGADPRCTLMVLIAVCGVPAALMWRRVALRSLGARIMLAMCLFVMGFAYLSSGVFIKGAPSLAHELLIQATTSPFMGDRIAACLGIMPAILGLFGLLAFSRAPRKTALGWIVGAFFLVLLLPFFVLAFHVAPLNSWHLALRPIQVLSLLAAGVVLLSSAFAFFGMGGSQLHSCRQSLTTSR
jgi:hypothetical protein